MSSPEILQACRLSIILPTRGNRARAELGVRSLLDQVDPIGIEIIAVDDDPDGSTADYLKMVFADAVREQRLRLHACPRRTGDWGWLKNEGAQIAQGAYLSFLHPEETWQPGGLARIEPLLYGNDLILASDEAQNGSPVGDALLKLLESGKPIKSSMIIHRALWDDVGGYPEGYSGIPFPKKLPGDENYELWLKALLKLIQTERKNRFAWVPNRYIVANSFSTVGLGPAFTQNLPALRQWTERVEAIKRGITVSKLALKLPRQYWARMGLKAVGSLKERLQRQLKRKR